MTDLFTIGELQHAQQRIINYQRVEMMTMMIMMMTTLMPESDECSNLQVCLLLSAEGW